MLTTRLACVAAAGTHCGDAGGGAGASTSGEASTGDTTTDVPTTGDDGTGDESTGDESTGDASTGEPTTGGVTPSTCAPTRLPGPIADGAWDRRFTVGGVAGPDGDAPHVADFARDKDGTVLAAGRFRWLGSERIKPLVRSPKAATGDGAWESARGEWELEPEVFGGLSAVAVGPAGELALATTGFAPAIWIDAGSGLEEVGLLSGSSDLGFVRAMAWYDGALWVAGNFALAGDELAYLAVWDGKQWASPPGGEADAAVSELLVAEGKIHVGGAFEEIGGVPARRVAAWDGAAWQAFDMDWPQAAVVASLALSAGGDLVAGGRFSDVPADECPTHGSVAMWTGAEWQMLGLGVSSPDVICGSYPGFVYDIALHQGELYITGSFSHANGPVDGPMATPTRDFARWTGDGWESLDGGAPVRAALPWVPIGNEFFGVAGQRLFSDGERLLAGVLGPGAGDVASPGLIAYQGDQWVRQGPAPRLAVYTSAAEFAVGGPECALHIMGTMSHLGDEPLASSVLRFDGEAWTPLGPKVPESLTCQRGIAVDGEGTVFAACNEAQGVGSQVLTLVDDAWQSLGAPAAPGQVLALAIDPRGSLWAVGGVFAEVGMTPSGFVARRDGDAWTVVESGINGLVSHIDFAPDDDGAGPLQYVIGGRFSQVAGAAHGRVARWDGAAWQKLGAGLQKSLSALEYGRDGIYASDTLDGLPASMIVGRWDGEAWVELATAEHQFPDLIGVSVGELIEVGDAVIVSGSLYGSEFPPAERSVLAFDGRQFAWLGGGVAASFMRDAAVTPEGLWFSGSIAEAGVEAGRVSSIGVAHFRWAE